MPTRSYVLIDAEVHCHSCDWHSESNNAQAIAKIHARKYGHHTFATLSHLASYNYTDVGPVKP
jgi:hypothetical protein